MSFNFGTYNPAPSYPNYTNAFGYGQQGYGVGNFGAQGGFNNWNQQQYANVMPNPGMGSAHHPPMPFQQQPMTWGDNGAYKNFQQQPSSPYPSHGGDIPVGVGSRPYGMMPQVAPSGPSAQAFYGGDIKVISVTPIAPGRGCGMSPMNPMTHAGGKFY